MTAPTLPVTLGAANAQTIVANVAPNDLMAPLQSITLSHDYARNAPSGWPCTPAGASSAAQQLFPNPTTIVSGTSITVTAPEAAALIAAGAAS
jgi:hypothetical protein